MRDLSIVMEDLRRVREARRRFMQLWRVERDVINPMLDRMADDLQDVIVPGTVDNDDDPGHQTPAEPGD
jgi:hypothetical protein